MPLAGVLAGAEHAVAATVRAFGDDLPLGVARASRRHGRPRGDDRRQQRGRQANEQNCS
jgi:hypothetical protein